jgi:hypothetical protein
MRAPTGGLQAALTAVDHLVRREREPVVALLTIDARRREQKPTDKQFDLLGRRRIPIPDGLTRGQASWLIMQSSARRQTRIHDGRTHGGSAGCSHGDL